MIKYLLNCKICRIEFESWFASSKEYEKLKKKNFLNCHSCNSIKIEKNLMAPSLINNKTSDAKYNKQLKKFNSVRKTISEYQKFIKNNFEYVGDNFAYEARSIHYDSKDDKKNKKGIYGSASLEEVKELQEEGIKTETIPWVKEEKN